MVSAGFVPIRYRWLVALCAAVVLFGLAAHLTADATSGSPDLVGVRGSNPAGLQSTTCSLLAVLAMPAMACIAILLVIVFPLSDTRLARLTWFSLPPVRPPIILR